MPSTCCTGGSTALSRPGNMATCDRVMGGAAWQGTGVGKHNAGVPPQLLCQNMPTSVVQNGKSTRVGQRPAIAGRVTPHAAAHHTAALMGAIASGRHVGGATHRGAVCPGPTYLMPPAAFAMVMVLALLVCEGGRRQPQFALAVPVGGPGDVT